MAALCTITLAFYHGLWFPGLVLIKRDAFRFYLPVKQYIAERIAAGEIPHWFPYEALGRPLIGVTAFGVFHPFTTLYFFLSAPDAYRASTLLSCLLAALGAFALGRTLKLSRAGALLAGVTFALSGYVVSMTDNIPYLYSICLLPLFCAALERALSGPVAWTAAPAIILATVFLQGDVQTGYYFGFVALCWMGARAPRGVREAWRTVALTGGLAILLAGVQLGPAWAVFANTDRIHPDLFKEQALHWSTHPLRLITILAAPGTEQATGTDVTNFFFGVRPTITEVPGGVWAESLYLGVPVIGLALFGVWHRRDLRVLTMLAGLSLLLALGRRGGLYELFYHVIPFWSAFRYPEKLMGMVAFAAALLAGAGLDALRAGHGRLLPWFAATGLCATVGLALHTDAAGAWTAAHYGAPAPLAHAVTGAVGDAFLFSAVATLGVAVIMLALKQHALPLTMLAAGVLAIVTLDLARANVGAYHTAPAEAATFVPPLAQALVAREGPLHPGRFRLFSIPEERFVLPPDLTRLLGTDGAVSVERRHALDMEHNAQFHLETFNVYLSSYSSRYRGFLNLTIGVAGAARYNVAYYIGRRGRVKDPQFANTLVAELPEFGLALFRSSVPVKPRAYLSLRPERADSPVEPAALIARSEFLSGEVDVIETPETGLPGPAPDGQAVIERYAPEEVRVRVETPRAAVLILLDAFERGWTATLDDATDLPIRRANVLARAVVVPAGRHVITFRYETPLLLAGAGASLAGCTVCLVLLARGRGPSSRTSPP